MPVTTDAKMSHFSETTKCLSLHARCHKKARTSRSTAPCQKRSLQFNHLKKVPRQAEGACCSSIIAYGSSGLLDVVVNEIGSWEIFQLLPHNCSDTCAQVTDAQCVSIDAFGCRHMASGIVPISSAFLTLWPLKQIQPQSWEGFVPVLQTAVSLTKSGSELSFLPAYWNQCSHTKETHHFTCRDGEALVWNLHLGLQQNHVSFLTFFFCRQRSWMSPGKRCRIALALSRCTLGFQTTS